jgi:NAD(P)-dependent dehydrogenase (short-subunit alcohol dehydrogenase family)
MRLPSQVALVTGAASGIARAVAIRFAQEGAAVMVADAGEGGGMETVEKIRACGGKALFANLDVSEPEAVRRVVQRTIDELGDLHILFNGAGILVYGTALETTDETWNRVMTVNLTGTFLCSRAALAHMVVKRRGAIINVASTTGSHDACAHAAAYVTSKGGVTLLTSMRSTEFASTQSAPAPPILRCCAMPWPLNNSTHLRKHFP